MGNSVITRSAVDSAAIAGVENVRFGMVVRSVGKAGLLATPLTAYFFLWAPILLLVLFSFNDSGPSICGGDSRCVGIRTSSVVLWVPRRGSLRSLMMQALSNTLLVGLVSTLIATTLGTMIALSLARSNLPGKRIIDGLMFLPVVIPEITQGVSLAIFFKIVFDFLDLSTGMRAAPGFGTIIIGHVAFNISYVAIVVRARLANMNPRLEEAANDLGANTWQTFRRITLPLIMPGIVAGGLLALTLSMDDLVITFFNAGVGTTTLPMFVYGLIKTAVTPEVNALSTLMLVFSTIVVGVSLMLQNRYTERPYTRQ